MKKYLLSLLIIGLTFIGFSSSQFIKDDVYSFKLFGGQFSPSVLTVSDIGRVDFTYIGEDGCIVIFDRGDFRCRVYFNWGSTQYRNDCVNKNYGGGFNIRLDGGACGGTIKAIVKSEILPVSSLTPVVSGLFSVFGELIPYVIYIGIGMLLVTLGFYAIRWLVNWLYKKINNNFKF